MEDKSAAAAAAVNTAATTPNSTTNGKQPPLDGEINKRRGTFTLFKAATLLIHHRPNAKPNSEVASKFTFKKITGLIRPFHLQGNQYQSLPPSVHPKATLPTVYQQPNNVSTPLPPSSQSNNRSSANSEEGMSQYGLTTNLQELDKGSECRYSSAVNLQALDKERETDKEEEDGINGNGGDKMIDSKADEFIAQFYLQMRVQQLESVERYNKMSQNYDFR